MDVQPLRDHRLASRGPVVDALAEEAIHALDAEPTPLDTRREDDRPRDHALAPVDAVQEDLARRRIDVGDRARDQDLRPETLRLLERPPRQLVPGDAPRKSEIVLDPRGGLRLTSRRFALHDERAQPL